MTRKFLKSVLSLMAIIVVSVTANAQENDIIKISKETLEEFEVIASDVANKVKKIKENPKFKTNPENFKSEIKNVTKPLVMLSKRLMTEGNISANEIPELNGKSLTDEQAIISGLLIFTSQTNLAIQSNSVGGCIANAVVGIELHEGFWSNFTNKRVMLKLLGKTLTRALGPISAALIVYDFADCMGWI